jgi:hypothetical protein
MDWLTCAEQMQRALEPIDVTLKLPQLTESEQLEITAARTIQHIFTTIGRTLAFAGDDRDLDEQLTAGTASSREKSDGPRNPRPIVPDLNLSPERSKDRNHVSTSFR